MCHHAQCASHTHLSHPSCKGKSSSTSHGISNEHCRTAFSGGFTHFRCTNASLHVQQVVSVPQPSDSSWSSHITTYTSTTLSGVSYRPLTSSSRPSTAHPATPRAAHQGSHPRPASARDHTGRLTAGHASAHSPGSPVSAAAAVVRMDNGHLHVTQLVQSKGQQQSGYRSVSPVSGGSTGATPSPAQTPCSVLSRPSTAGQHRLLFAQRAPCCGTVAT